jgi:hypothetical protein
MRAYLVAVSCAYGPIPTPVHSGIYASESSEILKSFYEKMYQNRPNLKVCVTPLTEVQIFDKTCHSYNFAQLLKV